MLSAGTSTVRIAESSLLLLLLVQSVSSKVAQFGHEQLVAPLQVKQAKGRV